MKILKAGAVYFALVFASGFVLGTLRVLLLVPRVGARTAELLEMPVMLVVIVVAARWVVRRLAVPGAVGSRLGMGVAALGLLLLAEFSLVLGLRGVSIGEYFANLDSVSGTAYYVMLGVFAVMPMLVVRRMGGK